MAYTKRKCLSLRPIPAAIQRVAVYETRTVSPIPVNFALSRRYPALCLLFQVGFPSIFVVVAVRRGLHERRNELPAVEDRPEPAEFGQPTSEHHRYGHGIQRAGDKGGRLREKERGKGRRDDKYVTLLRIQLLIMLDDGNKYAANKFKSQHGLKQVASAFGIIGR